MDFEPRKEPSQLAFRKITPAIKSACAAKAAPYVEVLVVLGDGLDEIINVHKGLDDGLN